MSIANVGGASSARLDVSRAVTSTTANVRQQSAPADPSAAGLDAIAAKHREDLARGDYSAAYRIRIGDWVATGYMDAGASKEELEKFVDEVLQYAQRMRGIAERVNDDEVEFRFADPSSVKTEQKIIQLGAQSLTSELAESPQDSASILANLLTDFLDKLRAIQQSDPTRRMKRVRVRSSINSRRWTSAPSLGRRCH